MLFEPGDAQGFLKPGAKPRHNPWMFAASLIVHALLLLAPIFWKEAGLIEPRPIRAIDVQIITAPAPGEVAQAPAVTPEKTRPQPVHLAPAPAVAPTALPVPPAPKKAAAPAPDAAAGDGMSHPTHLLAQAYIRDPASREIRQNLPKLAPSERVTQICNIEAGQQIQAANPKVLVDTVHAYGLGDATVDGLTITAPLAAYRSHRKWYGVSFICTVAPDYKSVTDFRFKVGDAIPRDLWDAHNLNAADENE